MSELLAAAVKLAQRNRPTVIEVLVVEKPKTVAGETRNHWKNCTEPKRPTAVSKLPRIEALRKRKAATLATAALPTHTSISDAFSIDANALIMWSSKSAPSVPVERLAHDSRCGST